MGRQPNSCTELHGTATYTPKACRKGTAALRHSSSRFVLFCRQFVCIVHKHVRSKHSFKLSTYSLLYGSFSLFLSPFSPASSFSLLLYFTTYWSFFLLFLFLRVFVSNYKIIIEKVKIPVENILTWQGSFLT